MVYPPAAFVWRGFLFARSGGWSQVPMAFLCRWLHKVPGKAREKSGLLPGKGRLIRGLSDRPGPGMAILQCSS